MNIKNKSISIREIIEYFNLEILVDGDLDRRISENEIYRIGYELTGFFSDEIEELKNAIHIMGLKENNYLFRMKEEQKTEILDRYLSFPFPVLILSSRAKHIEILIERAKKKNKVVLRCSKRATEFIRELNIYLKNVLGEEIILEDHILLDVYGIGILLSGEQDLKLGAAIEMLERGHKFITDARMLLKNTANGIVGYNSAAKISPDRDFMLEMTDKEENINVTNNFGIKSTRPAKKINLIVELETWKTKKFYDRLGADEVYEDVGIGKLKKITLPARKGRNLAVIIETAAIDYRLKELGKNSALYFLNESKKLIQENKRKRESDEMEDETRLSIATFIKDNNIEVLIGEEYAHKSFITTTSIHKPAMALSGIFDLDESIYENKGLQLFTDVELKYLKTLCPEKRKKNLEKYFTYDFPAIVICGDVNVSDEIREEVISLIKKHKKVLLKVKETNPSYVVA
ncbi:MAG: serine kinase, partial [Fusobacterium sp.]